MKKKFRIGDEVKIKRNGQFGVIIGFDGECWVVNSGGDISEEWGSQLIKQ